MRGLIDSTLREGLQTVGVHFSFTQKLALVERLDRIGIEEIELGVVCGLDDELLELIRCCRSKGVSARLALWSRCNKEDIDHAGKLQPDVISLSIPVSDSHIEIKLRRDRQWVITAMQKSVAQARQWGIGTVSLGLEDATRAEPIFVNEVIREAVKAGITRIRLADTVGIASPHEFSEIILKIKGQFAVEVAVHAHNDFGLATANSLAALEAGAEWADVTVLGLGERAGSARLEEMAGYLSLRKNRPYQLKEAVGLARKVASWCGRNIDAGQPVIGERIFHCETGLHLQGLREDTRTYEPYPPEAVGASRQLFFGSKVGKRQIRDSLSALGFHVHGNQLDTLARKIRHTAISLGRPIEANEFNTLVTSSYNK